MSDCLQWWVCLRGLAKGLALERFFLENTKQCSGPAPRAVCTGTNGLGADLETGAGMGLGLTAARDVCHCARESRSALCARWGHRLNNLRGLNKFSFSCLSLTYSYTQSLSVRLVWKEWMLRRQRNTSLSTGCPKLRRLFSMTDFQLCLAREQWKSKCSWTPFHV